MPPMPPMITATNDPSLKDRARKEVLNAWMGIRDAAQVFGLHRRDYCRTWLINVYGETFGLEEEL